MAGRRSKKRRRCRAGKVHSPPPISITFAIYDKGQIPICPICENGLTRTSKRVGRVTRNSCIREKVRFWVCLKCNRRYIGITPKSRLLVSREYLTPKGEDYARSTAQRA